MTLGNWNDSWERLMVRYQPGRERAIERMIDLVASRCDGGVPRVLDVGGGTGTLCSRLLERLPGAEVTLVDLDPVMLAIAGASLPSSVEVVRADLRDPEWVTRLPDGGYDAVLAVMALHYLPPGRLTELYTELAGLVRAGGFVATVDDMPDAGAAVSAGDDVGTPWSAWWEQAAADPVLGPAVVERARLFGDAPSAEWHPPAAWHLRALGACPVEEPAVVWRDGVQAAVVAFRPR
ncbi:class I SAM-dependent methyltransferase [Amycolatopsis roodepoortensis]|uniref:class I SAM-dependent methyltransferase n=1 Tax=Amycolatopsis roodepoortensis TaxID=700274 RepID=UPI00214BE31B|nr:class I SAM-dependent methyltransferase [Amycolatopsis roodepoortensis]UUV34714.1 class I SAM-dependent methyltransferase [Amycolatopsis roodepoortensis]